MIVQYDNDGERHSPLIQDVLPTSAEPFIDVRRQEVQNQAIGVLDQQYLLGRLRHQPVAADPSDFDEAQVIAARHPVLRSYTRVPPLLNLPDWSLEPGDYLMSGKQGLILDRISQSMFLLPLAGVAVALAIFFLPSKSSLPGPAQPKPTHKATGSSKRLPAPPANKKTASSVSANMAPASATGNNLNPVSLQQTSPTAAAPATGGSTTGGTSASIPPATTAPTTQPTIPSTSLTVGAGGQTLVQVGTSSVTVPSP